MRAAWAPMGQSKVTGRKLKEWVTKRNEYINDSMLWPKTLMSFELWCVATGYDPTVEDGGQVFQQLMHYLLVYGQGVLPEEAPLVSKYYTGKRGPGWQQGNNHSGRYAGVSSNNAWLNNLKKPDLIKAAQERGLDTSGTIAVLKARLIASTDSEDIQLHSPETQGTHSERGGHVGAWSGDPRGFIYPFGTGSNKTQASAWQLPVARAPCSKLNWLQSVSTMQLLSPMLRGSHSHSSEASFATAGTTQLCTEIEGCMAQANLTASIIGLYFYPGCNAPENNWTVRQQTNVAEYKIRMRMWNPNYVPIDNGRLFVQEPLNKEAELPSDYERFVGGRTESVEDFGFIFPDIFQENGYPLEPSLFIRSSNDNTRLAPFFGSSKPPKGGIGAQKGYKAICARLSTAWGNLVHEPEKDAEGTYFGFNVPKAHWLYPHYIPDADEVQPVGDRLKATHMTTANTYSGTPMQRWPLFKVSSARERADLVIRQQVVKFYQLFDMPNVREMTDDERRKYALGAPEQASSTQPGPSDAQSVPVPPTASAPPLAAAEEQTVQDEQLESTTDGTTEESTDAIRHESALDIGFVKEVGLSIQPRGAMLESEGSEVADISIETDEDKLREQFNVLAGYRKDATNLEQLEPGATMARNDLNLHWSTVQNQPWPHKDCYDTVGLKTITGELMGEQELREYEEQYGSRHNLYLRGETVPKRILGMEQQFGFAKSILNTRLDTDTELHHKHMCRILAIYFYANEIGTGAQKITAQQKRDGMLHGVWAKKVGGTETSTVLQYGASPADYVCLWPKVFDRAPDARWRKWFDLTLMRGDNKDLHNCLVADRLEKIKNVKSSMTVMQWITSPWHYAFLPYQPQSVMFKDGETYSEGCVRCSRPFYEFEKMYAPFRKSEPNTQHWSTGYWTLDKSGNPCGLQCAPVPFHDERFWSSAQAHATPMPQNAAKENIPQGYDEFGGWHNWPTFHFPINQSIYLKGEFAKRKTTLEKNKLLSKINQGKPLPFRRYLNHVWDPTRVTFWGGSYPSVTQGRLSRNKVKFGMREYKLQRAAKYGNVCRDCAAVLELAPGLLHRNHRTVYNIGMVIGNRKKHEIRETWWTNLINRVGADEGMLNFDPDTLHHKKANVLSRLEADEREEYLRSFEDSMRTFAKYLSEHHVPALGLKTKYKEPPDIYIQKVVPGMKDSSRKKDHSLIKEAIRDLKVMLTKPQSEWQINTDNKAFRDMVYELERKYVHKERFDTSEHARVFDSEMIRLEIRDEQRDLNGVTYHNCLVTRLYQPRGPATGGTQPPEEDYEENVYYATRKGPMGDVEHTAAKPTMWAGDGYVTRYDQNEEHWVPNPGRLRNSVRQWRKMRQSRLFITYSLHRAVSSEYEARLLMERMADAAHELFGNDYNLSELLVFGYKLGGFVSKKETADTLGVAQFNLIQEPNKKDALETFYGEPNASSYIYDTYDTHVDKVEVDGGIEIGPNRHHPHFHILLTINHWSYVQIDYFKMNAYLELMFRGLDPMHRGWGDRFKLVDASGGLFYTDNENPYVDIKLYPQDNWQDIINAYVRKNTTPGIMETLRNRNIFKKYVRPNQA